MIIVLIVISILVIMIGSNIRIVISVSVITINVITDPVRCSASSLHGLHASRHDMPRISW